MGGLLLELPGSMAAEVGAVTMTTSGSPLLTRVWKRLEVASLDRASLEALGGGLFVEPGGLERLLTCLQVGAEPLSCIGHVCVLCICSACVGVTVWCWGGCCLLH